MPEMKHIIYKVKQLMEGEDSLSFILDEIKKDIALDIIRTDFKEKERREELYMLTKAIEELTKKLQEYVNLVEEN
ncbi:hypothetical protein LAh9_5 [Aeromonas phage LAh_9]|uniref:Uncharacterized protein n=4 Tax=Lahexavirus TaxID=2843411 RepID=A0A514A118_9CAUD|nr:hypothetical protein HWC29_gp106 [Aeromonas phage 4_4572]YP_009847182.1 hypothetical protein HWC30_gp008 [Aeromonas phage LAh_6]YP_009847405.1 hypothetical protein HWC31_gp067 [Aeromonas phage LAh_8]YP_009847486.1 hypothetical protein HWC32_gp005 [Aeromonas phage LAh_9]QDH46595.1 hypothetical protein LAh6_8 [Aeromonas phage LAh_6]QDH46827.1 hypothetical protein LAh8_67 [Aeromonas phage LAh_8]QDH46970.1 hypothetical protein LAh9_5 [Aeromonas phage LAh_9]QEG09080.1 hypothetical protein [Aer